MTCATIDWTHWTYLPYSYVVFCTLRHYTNIEYSFLAQFSHRNTIRPHTAYGKFHLNKTYTEAAASFNNRNIVYVA